MYLAPESARKYMFPFSQLCMVFPLSVGCMIGYCYLHLGLVWELFLSYTELILFACKVGQTQEIELLNSCPDQCQMLPISCHSTDIVCLAPNHNLYLSKLKLLSLVKGLAVIWMVELML